MSGSSLLSRLATRCFKPSTSASAFDAFRNDGRSRMADQMSATMPKELLSKLVTSGVSIYCQDDGDIVFIQAHRVPRGHAQFFSDSLMIMSHQQPATPKN